MQGFLFFFFIRRGLLHGLCDSARVGAVYEFIIYLWKTKNTASPVVCGFQVCTGFGVVKIRDEGKARRSISMHGSLSELE